MADGKPKADATTPAAGLGMHPAHFPDRAPIDAYGNGGFRFAEMSHRGSILCVPSGIYAWEPTRPEDVDLAAFARVRAEAARIDLLLVGMGRAPVPLPEPVAWALRDSGVRFDAMTTGAAVRTFNVLLSEERAVAAALIAVE